MKNNIEIYAYCRVSTDEQEKIGFSIREQVTDLIEFARKLSKTLEEENIYVDDGYSATHLKRPNIQRLLHKLSSNKDPKLLLVRHPDRLVRNLLLKRSLENVFLTYNVTVLTLDGSWEGKNIDENLVSDISMLFAEGEVKKIPKRVKDGYRGSALYGNYVLGGRTVPRGYRRIQNDEIGKGSKIIPDEVQAIEIVKIFNTLATNLVNIKEMARYLNKHRILGLKWSEKQLTRLIDNPIYYGHLKKDWFDSEDPNIPDCEKKGWFSTTQHTEPIVSKELWLNVQKIVHHKKAMTRHTYLFKRLVYCECCDSYLTCKPAHKKTKKGKRVYLYYYCEKCNRRINQDLITTLYIEQYPNFKKDVSDKQLINNLKSKISNIRKRIEYINCDFDNGLIDDETYAIDIKNAYQTIKKTQAEINTIKSSNTDNFNSLSTLQKRTRILATVERVNIDVKTKEISFIFKTTKK